MQVEVRSIQNVGSSQIEFGDVHDNLSILDQAKYLLRRGKTSEAVAILKGLLNHIVQKKDRQSEMYVVPLILQLI